VVVVVVVEVAEEVVVLVVGFVLIVEFRKFLAHGGQSA
jgi:hypothetical protein